MIHLPTRLGQCSTTRTSMIRTAEELYLTPQLGSPAILVKRGDSDCREWA
jgi:hypothetical protein